MFLSQTRRFFICATVAFSEIYYVISSPSMHQFFRMYLYLTQKDLLSIMALKYTNVISSPKALPTSSYAKRSEKVLEVGPGLLSAL